MIRLLGCVFAILFFGFIPLHAAVNAMERLQEGNKRYMKSKTVCHADWTAQRTALTQNQTPYAVVVCCADSRVPPEIIFDETLGSLFIVRTAGNVIDDIALGSVEYGVSVLGAKLILVLGHASCGAVEAALKGMTFDNHIQMVVDAIEPAIKSIERETGNRLEKAIKANVFHVKERLKTARPVIAQMLYEGTIQIAGGYYHLDSGRVEFLN